MKNRAWILFVVLISLIVVTACQPNLNDDPNTTPAINETLAMDNPITKDSTEVIITLTANEATEEPTFSEITGESLQTWMGTIESLPAGSQFNDQFKSESLKQGVCGIDGNSDELNKLITQYRGIGSIISVQGVMTLDIPDVNGCQIRVTSLTLE